jgi:hypothetical protein
VARRFIAYLLILAIILRCTLPYHQTDNNESRESSYDCAIHLIGFFGGLVAGLWTVLNWWRAQNLGRWLRKNFFPNSQDH